MSSTTPETVQSNYAKIEDGVYFAPGPRDRIPQHDIYEWQTLRRPTRYPSALYKAPTTHALSTIPLPPLEGVFVQQPHRISS